MIGRRRQCRVPTMLFWVGTRHYRLLISASNNSDATGNDIILLFLRALRINPTLQTNISNLTLI